MNSLQDSRSLGDWHEPFYGNRKNARRSNHLGEIGQTVSSERR